MDLKQLMNPMLIAVTVAVILAVAVPMWLYVQRRRRATTAALRQRFGPEYELAVEEHGSERRAEAQLEAREKRVEKLKIRELDPTSGNTSLASGRPYSSASSTIRRRPSQEPTSSFPA